MSRTREHNAAIGASLRARGIGSSPTKMCPRCRKELPRSDFGTRPTGHTKSLCPPCERAYNAQKARRHYANHPEHRERRRLANQRAQFKRKYGLTVDEFERMKAEQCGRCAICGEQQGGGRIDLCVDHSHRTGTVRGLLCNRCNRGIGLFRDDEELLEKAARYLLERVD